MSNDSEFLLSKITEVLDIVRMMREPDTGNPLEQFTCALELETRLGNHEVWNVNIEREMGDD